MSTPVLRALLVTVAAAAAACSSTDTTAPTSSDLGAERTTSAPTSVETSASTPTTLATTTTVDARRAALACVRALPVEVRAGQLVWPAVYGNELRERTEQFASWGVGGAVLMTWPDVASAEQLLALKAAGSWPLLIATDEEGGNVQRMARLGEVPAAADVVTMMSSADAESMIADHAAILRPIGIDIAFAPVVDVGPTSGRGPIGERVFSSDAAVVAEYAAAYVEGWQSAGIVPVLKHFPGHGSASADTHDLGAGTPALDVLRQRDLLPYAALADTGAAVMIGHLEVPGLTEPGLPASLSPAALSLLRTEYGYDNALVFTDALGMRAISDRWDSGEASVLAIAAGVDVVIFTATNEAPAIIEAIAGAVFAGVIAEDRLDEAVLRVLTTKAVDPCAASSG